MPPNPPPSLFVGFLAAAFRQWCIQTVTLKRLAQPVMQGAGSISQSKQLCLCVHTVFGILTVWWNSP